MCIRSSAAAGQIADAASVFLSAPGLIGPSIFMWVQVLTPLIASVTNCSTLTANFATALLSIYISDPKVWVTVRFEKLAEILMDPQTPVIDFALMFAVTVGMVTVAAALSEQAQRPDFRVRAAPRIIAGMVAATIFASTAIGGVGTAVFRGVVTRRLVSYGIIDATDIVAAVGVQVADKAMDLAWLIASAQTMMALTGPFFGKFAMAASSFLLPALGAVATYFTPSFGPAVASSPHV